MIVYKKAFLSVAALSVVLMLYLFTNPLRISEDIIKSKILLEIPIGTKMTEVERYIKKKKWKISYIDNTQGFYDQRQNACSLNGRMVLTNSESSICIVGNKSILAEIGKYGVLSTTSVDIFLGFDEKFNLIDVWVWKTTEAL